MVKYFGTINLEIIILEINIVKEEEEMGLKINLKKTKIIRIGDRKIIGNIKIGPYEFEQVDKFKYLGIVINSYECTVEIQA